ncbi:relaxase/mobilization nuclease domain-containing protein [Sulfurimonas sp.]|uniref:relaxase/mobilization nuclease domain-containing protein n=1 Tax=Sulfurimonas sp. TaxID=2022749 RepID=UPI002AAFDA3B|nr:hypothetical protein [Sulfurimonas sp.]
MSLAQEYEEYDRAGKKAKASRSKIMYFKSLAQSQISYYDGVPTPVVFKIIKSVDKATGKTNRNVGYSTMKALDYLARDVDELNEDEALDKIEQMEQDRPDFLDKNLVLECDDGRKLESKQDRLILYNEWKETFTNRKNGKDFEHILLSTKETPGTHDKEILDAARQTLSKQFAKDGYNYIFVLHRDTEHTHVHAIVRVHNAMEDKRLDIKKDDINKVKDTFASELRSRGLNYENFINFNKILGINSQLKYLQHNDLSWFQSNMKKFENENIDGLLKTIKSIDKNLEILIKQKENIKLSRKDKKVISDNISHLYADKRAIIHKLNGLEYDLQQATKNYTSLIKKRDSIEWYLKQTGAYKEIDKRTNEAQELVIQKKLELNKAQLYIETTKGKLTFSSKIKKDTLYYLNDYLKDDSKKDINSLLYRLNTLETKMPKSKLVKEIKQLKKDLQGDKYKETVKADFIKVLHEINIKNKDIVLIDKKINTLIKKINNDKDVFVNEIKNIGFNINDFETFSKVYKVDHIKNTPANLKEFEKFKDLIDDITYQNLTQKIIENRLTNKSFEYTLQKAKITSLPIDMKLSLELDKKNIEVQILNIESFHKYLNNNIEEFSSINENINLDSFSKEAYKIIENQNYKEVFTEIENMKFENLSMEKNKNDFYKLFAVISNAKDAKDIDTLVEAYKLDSLSDKSQMIKDFGKALNVNPQNIKKNIWYNNTKQPPPEVWDKTNDFVLETMVHDYKEQFIEEYVNEISMEYLLFMSEKSDMSEELIQKNIDQFNKGLEDFKEEYFLNEEYQKNIESVKEHLKYGEFKSAREVIENSNLGEVDIKILDGYYEEHIDMFANDLELAASHINKENELEQKTYLLKDFVENDKYKYPPKKEQEFIKPKEIAKELETDLTPLVTIPTGTKEQLEPIDPTKYDKLKVQYVNKEKEFINKLIVTLDKSLNEQKVHDYKDMIFKASKTLSSELKRNVNQIEDIKRVLEEMPKNYKVEKKCLEENLNDFFSKANKTNDAVKQYIETIDKSDLDNKSKLEYKLGLYDELAKYRYSERITNVVPSIKNEMLDRGIEHFKLINKQLETPKIDKETKLELLDKSSQLLKDFNKLNPTWKQERTITKLHKEQVKNLKQRDMER